MNARLDAESNWDWNSLTSTVYREWLVMLEFLTSMEQFLQLLRVLTVNCDEQFSIHRFISLTVYLIRNICKRIETYNILCVIFSEEERVSTGRSAFVNLLNWIQLTYCWWLWLLLFNINHTINKRILIISFNLTNNSIFAKIKWTTEFSVCYSTREKCLKHTSTCIKPQIVDRNYERAV